GQIDGAEELFGTATDGKWFADGFHALAELDANRDGRIDARDPLFAALLLWRDSNHDGKSTLDELMPLSQEGIGALELKAQPMVAEHTWDRHGNELAARASFLRVDGSRGTVVDAFLRYAPTKSQQDEELTAAVL